MALPYNPFLKPALGTPINKARAKQLGLVAYYLMNEKGGTTVFNLSGEDHRGTFVGGPIWTGGKFGPAVNFDGTDDYITLGTSINMAGWSELTVIGWMKPASGAANDHVLIGNWEFNNAEILVRADRTTNNLDVFVQEEADSAIGGVDIQAIGDFNVWHQIGFTWRAFDALRPYIDGLPTATTFASGAVLDAGASSELCIGRRTPIHADKLTGQIGHIMICNRALAASEMVQLYREPFTMFEPSFNVIESFTPAVGVSIPVMIHHYKQVGGL